MSIAILIILNKIYMNAHVWIFKDYRIHSNARTTFKKCNDLSNLLLKSVFKFSFW